MFRVVILLISLVWASVLLISWGEATVPEEITTGAQTLAAGR